MAETTGKEDKPQWLRMKVQMLSRDCLCRRNFTTMENLNGSAVLASSSVEKEKKVSPSMYFGCRKGTTTSGSGWGTDETRSVNDRGGPAMEG